MFGLKLTSVVLLLSLVVASFANPAALPVSLCSVKNLSPLLTHISKQVEDAPSKRTPPSWRRQRRPGVERPKNQVIGVAKIERSIDQAGH